MNNKIDEYKIIKNIHEDMKKEMINVIPIIRTKNKAYGAKNPNERRKNYDNNVESNFYNNLPC